MTDLTGLLRSVEGDGVHWTLETSGDLNVNLVHLDAGHAVDEHTNDEVDVVIVVLAGRGRLTIDGHGADVSAHVVAEVPRRARRSLRAADDGPLDYLSIHRRRGPLDIRRGPTGPAATGASHDEGGDPACWAHLFEDEQPLAALAAEHLEELERMGLVYRDLGQGLPAGLDG